MTTAETRTVADTALQKRLVFAWLDALRSGEWKQAKGCLENAKGNCCLGVACRVAIRDGFNMCVEENMYDGEGSVTRFNSVSYYMPLPLRDAMGLRDSGGRYVDESGKCTALAWRNDHGTPFHEIADTVEREARTLFVNGDDVATWIAERKQQST